MPKFNFCLKLVIMVRIRVTYGVSDETLISPRRVSNNGNM